MDSVFYLFVIYIVIDSLVGLYIKRNIDGIYNDMYVHFTLIPLTSIPSCLWWFYKGKSFSDIKKEVTEAMEE